MKRFTSKKLMALLSMLMMVCSVNADVIISKVYYSGTKTIADNKNYTGAPEYIELYNNSAKEYDIAGMYVALVESESSTGAYLVKDQTNNDVKLKQIYQIPVETPFVVAPWSTVVLAANAIDHSSVAIGGQNLSKADFEFGGQKSGDNPDVPNLVLKYSYLSTMPNINLANGGDAGVLLITKANGDKYILLDKEENFVFPNGKDKGNKYYNFNAYYAMDAVEILKTKKNSETGKYEIDETRKRICNSKDAGYVPVPDNLTMNRDGYVAYRKTGLNDDGKIYLYDTNNSCVDFKVSNTINTKEYDSEEADATPLTVTVPESGYLPFNSEKFFFTGKDLALCYVSITSGTVKFNNSNGHTFIANNSPYILVGAPGEHTIYYTKAARTLASAGADNWIADEDSKYADGILTITTKNRFPMKFVNEKGNVHFQRETDGSNNQTLKIDVATEGRFYINHTVFNEGEPSIAWGGITPEEVIAAGISTVNTHSAASNAVYNLQGIKMNAAKLPRGIYVKAGKKFIVK